jgi:hypothetical protein
MNKKLQWKYYYIFWIDTLKNKWISETLKIRIHELLNNELFKNDHNIIINLQESLSNDDIYDYINWVNWISTEQEKILFISLEIVKNDSVRSKNNIYNLNLNNLCYIDDFISMIS